MATAKIPRRGVRPPAASWTLSLNDPTVRAIVWQAVALVVVVGVGWFLVNNTMKNLEARNIASGFGFLQRESGFAIGEAVIPFSPADTYSRALFVGFLNTIQVAVAGVILATILGTLIGLARLSTNWLLAKGASVYVEVMRNLPLLLQLFFWYAIITENMPGPREALHPAPGVYVSNRGIKFPLLEDHPVHDYMLVALMVGILAAYLMARWAKQRQNLTGQQFPVLPAGAGLIIGIPAVVWLLGGAPTGLDLPTLRGFNFAGGGTLTPEFAALLAGLVTYTAAFIAEIVRSGILAVSHGQTEAASALGLRRGLVMRLVVLPQALRVIVPPMTSQYLNLTKNSSLAVAIGYPDLVSIANTTMNQTGQAIEGIAIIMAVYLAISLTISVLMNWYNRRIRLVER